MPTNKLVCRHCYHPVEVHNVNETGECGCGCVRLVPIDYAAREARKRTWIAEVEMFVKNRWIASGTFRVRAGGAAGAAAAGATPGEARAPEATNPRGAVQDFADAGAEVRGEVGPSAGPGRRRQPLCLRCVSSVAPAAIDQGCGAASENRAYDQTCPRLLVILRARRLPSHASSRVTSSLPRLPLAAGPLPLSRTRPRRSRPQPLLPLLSVDL